MIRARFCNEESHFWVFSNQSRPNSLSSFWVHLCGTQIMCGTHVWYSNHVYCKAFDPLAFDPLALDPTQCVMSTDSCEQGLRGHSLLR